MGITSWIFNRFGDLLRNPENSLASDLSNLQGRKNRLQAAVLDTRRLFDAEFVEFDRHLRRMVSNSELSFKEYGKIKELCGVFLNSTREKIEEEKDMAMESARLSSSKVASVGIVRLAGIALEIIDKKENIIKIERAISELETELSRIRKTS